jgi:hypothetical protein
MKGFVSTTTITLLATGLIVFAIGAQSTPDKATTVESLRSLGMHLKANETASGKPIVEAQLSYEMPAERPSKDFRQLRTLTTLRKVRLTGEWIGDEFIEYLKDLKCLEEVSVVHSLVSDDGINTLSRIKTIKKLRLEVLWIRESPNVTGSGLLGLRKLRRLRELDLDWSAITDDGVKALSGHKSLEDLSLNGCLITDKALEYCKKMPNLCSLAVEHTAIRDTDIEAFRKARPHVSICDETEFRQWRIDNFEKWDQPGNGFPLNRPE